MAGMDKTLHIIGGGMAYTFLRAMDRPTIDHRGPEFARLAQECLEGLKWVFRTEQPVIIFPASGSKPSARATVARVFRLGR